MYASEFQRDAQFYIQNYPYKKPPKMDETEFPRGSYKTNKKQLQ